MAPPLPATLVHCAVFSTSSRARRQRSPGPGTTAREHCRLASCKAVFVVLRCRGVDRSGQAARHHSRGSAHGRSYPHVSGPIRRCHRRRPRSFGCRSGSRVWPTHHAHAGGTRQSSHSACAAAPGLAQSGSPYCRLRSLLYAIIVRLLRDRMARTCRAQPKKVKRV